MYDFELIKKENIKNIIPFLSQLDPTISVATLADRIDDMVTQGYQCVGIYHSTQLIGISGLWILTKYYIGKHVEPDNVFILPEYRNKGLGQQLMQWIYAYAKSIGCVASELNCYIGNEAGQHFWETEGYEAIGIHYRRRLP